MNLKEVLFEIIIPLISGFVGGNIGNIIVNKRKMNNKKANFNNNGDIINGDKKF